MQYIIYSPMTTHDHCHDSIYIMSCFVFFQDLCLLLMCIKLLKQQDFIMKE